MVDDSIALFVPGHPMPAGSKRVFMVGKKGGPQRPIVTDTVDTKSKGADWRASVQLAIACVWPRPPFTCAVAIELHFVLPRPKGHFNAKGTRRPSAPLLHTTKPDKTKLERAVEDAANGLLWRDDSQIVRSVVTKRYGERIGVLIRCTPATPTLLDNAPVPPLEAARES
jgi:Holliday junction resolvase RusA-like endonuclease